MKIVLKLFVSISLFLILFSCSANDSSKTKASLILKEINEIAEKAEKDNSSKLILNNIKKFEEDRKHFPETREQMRNDAEIIKQFLLKSIEQDKQIIEKLKELQQSNLVDKESNCVKLSVDSSTLSIEKKETLIAQYALLFDESVKDKETLDSKTQLEKGKNVELDKKIEDLKRQKSTKCMMKK